MTAVLVVLVIALIALLVFASCGWWQAENAAKEWKTKCEWWREFAVQTDPAPGSMQELVREAYEFAQATRGDGEYTVTIEHNPPAAYNSVTVKGEDRCDP